MLVDMWRWPALLGALAFWNHWGGHRLSAISVSDDQPSAGVHLRASAIAAVGRQAAQERAVVLKEAPKSKMRTVRLEKVVTLDTRALGLEGSEMLVGLARTADGSWYLGVLKSMASSEATVYRVSPDGQTAVALAGKGSGPGELSYLNWLTVGMGDTVYALDRNRVTLFHRGSFVRTIAAPSIGTEIEALPGGRFMLKTGSIDLQFRIFDAHWKEVAAVPQPPGGANGQKLAVGKDAIWSVELAEYRLERWSTEGKSLGVFVRDKSWYQQPRLAERLIPSYLAAVRVDAEGRVWCVFADFRSSWKPGTDPRPGDIDMVVDVIDPRTATVISSQRFKGESFRIMSGHLVVHEREDADGFKIFEVSELKLD